jgi:nicotinate-nucleotide adenylyltransferase
MTKLIGVLGGTFDPIHFGHLRPALDVLQNVGLEQIRFLPNNIPPHREQPWLSRDVRKQLVSMAIADVPQFVLDERELNREGPSYMVDTLTELKAQFADDALCLIMGMDAFAGFTQWHQWQSILGLCHLIITTRPGSAMFDSNEMDFGEHHTRLKDRIVSDVNTLQARQHGQILLQSTTLLDISASQIRASLSNGKSIQYLLPENVREFLQQHYAN